jgi:hypothetical protein
MKKILLSFAMCITIIFAHAQTTITTNHTNNNGNGSVTFRVHNNNAFDIIITDVSCHLGSSGANNLQLLYNTAVITDNAAPWDFGTVGNGQNGWLLAGSATVSSNTANGVVPAITGMSLTIPAGATYTLGFSGTTIQYMTLVNGGGVNTFSGGGVDLLTGDGISWGGTAYPSTPANYPRGFIGGITFVPAVPCTAPPTAGTATATINPVCPSTNTTISLTGGTSGTGQTYQWQSSPDGISYTNIPGATNSSYVANQTSATYYQCVVTCSGQPNTSTPILVNMNSFMSCYCSSISAFTADEEIYQVTVNGGTTNPLYANASGCSTIAPGPGSILNRYSNFSTLPAITALDLGQTVNFSINQDECDGPTYYNNGIAIWIDYNHNGLFTDPGEQVFVEGATATGPRTVSGTFVVPNTATVGNTMMRVICAEGFSGGGLTPCMTYNYGETEDHLITINCPTLTGPTGIDVGVCSGNSTTVTATPTSVGATISWWDSPVGGLQLATTNSYVTPVLFVNTSYYAQEDFTSCPSSARTQIDVIVATVDVILVAAGATCNGLNDGTFIQTGVNCGTAPFDYSVDGGAFGPIPTNLLAGTHSVVVRDFTLATSVPYSVIIGEPGAPASLNVTNTTLFSATLDWVPQGSETQWTVEYGPAGFTPGLGTTVTASSIPYTIYGLTDETDYEFYVAAGCSPTSDFAGPYPFTTDAGFFTYDSDCGPGFIDISGTGTGLFLSDDASTTVTSGFPIQFQGINTTTVTVSNNGWITVGPAQFNPWNTDLDDEEGNVYYQTLNFGGDNLFIVQWDHRPRFPTVLGQNVTFELIINETTGEIYYIYEDVVFGGSQSSNDYGAQTEISVFGPITNAIVSSYDPTYLTNNSCAHFYNALCPNIMNFTANVLQEDAFLDWDAGLYGETSWTLIYGPAGFDPDSVPSSAIDTLYLSSSDANFGGTLSQLTAYDVYIYSECQADSLTSPGYFYSFTTLPWCSNPSALNASTIPDSVMANWTWFETDPSYPISGFNFQYGPTGFNLYSGTEVPANGIDFSDTIPDSGLLAGGVYELYIQAVCGVDTSSFIGPVTFIMPLTNDNACAAETILADGTIYTFNNNGATVTFGEDSIAPPANGLQVTTGWANSTLNNTTWFTFVAPASGNIRINNTAINYNGQAAVYDVANCGIFGTYNLIGANDNEIGGTSLAPNFTVCGLIPGNTYYLLHDGFDFTIGNYSISITPIILDAGSFVTTGNVCSGDDIDLFTTITGYDSNGVWSSGIPVVNTAISGSNFSSFALASMVFDFEYSLVDGCAHDSIISQVEIFDASNAGMDGTITACRNQPINLLAGLNGSTDLTGTWYDPAALPSSQLTTSNTAGTYIYTYVAGNGVCPNDTATVTVTVQACDFLALEDEIFDHVTVYPNPSDGIVFIKSEVSTPFDYFITDAHGRVIKRSGAGMIDTQLIQLDLTMVEAGVYFIHLSTTKSEKVFKLVIK